MEVYKEIDWALVERVAYPVAEKECSESACLHSSLSQVNRRGLLTLTSQVRRSTQSQEGQSNETGEMQSRFQLNSRSLIHVRQSKSIVAGLLCNVLCVHKLGARLPPLEDCSSCVYRSVRSI